MNTVLPQNLWSFIWHFLKKRKGFVIAFYCLSILTGFWGPFNLLLIRHIIDSLNTTHLDNVTSVILWPAVLLVLNFETHELCWRGMNYLNYKFQPAIKNQIISETFGYVHLHSNQFFQNNFAGRIANQIYRIADNVESIIHEHSPQILRCMVLLLISFISMYSVNPKFFYVLLIWFIGFASLGIPMSKRFISLSESHAASESVVSGQLVDSITNANNVRVFARRLYEISYLEKAFLLTKKSFQKKEMFYLKLSLVQGASLSIMLGFMLYFLIHLRSNNMVSVGDFALILGLSVEVGFMMWWALEKVNELNKSIGKCTQGISMLFAPLEIQEEKNAPDLVVTHGQVRFSEVKFHYKNTEPLFQNQSVTIEAGQKVGLVGYSGSGKSTFVSLILRLYDIDGGSILIDGQDIHGVTQDSLHQAIAMIPQDPSLFHRSLMENIRYGRVSASDEEVIESTKQAYAHEFIMRLPENYSSLVGERGVKLSGGQRQRIAIARAILKNAPILILDEATSQLDSLTEHDIQESLWKLMQGKTTIVIAHRLSTLMHMDRILVFDQGKIIQDGPHETLLKSGGLYKTLWDAQINGFLPDKRI